MVHFRREPRSETAKRTRGLIHSTPVTLPRSVRCAPPYTMARGASPEFDDDDVASTRASVIGERTPASVHVPDSVRPGEVMCVIRPSTATRSLPSAWMWMVQVEMSETSIVAAVIFAAFGPGLIVPMIVLPSHSSATVTWRAPTSPVHVPVSGWPSCAPGRADTKDTKANRKTKRLFLALDNGLSC